MLDEVGGPTYHRRPRRLRMIFAKFMRCDAEGNRETWGDPYHGEALAGSSTEIEYGPSFFAVRCQGV